MTGGKVRVWNESRGEFMDPQKVVDKFKVKPEQMLDYLALTGDVSAARISIEDGAYFKGGIDIKKVEGKSGVTHTPSTPEESRPTQS